MQPEKSMQLTEKGLTSKIQDGKFRLTFEASPLWLL
jgi:hypothetical protein